MRRRRFAAGQRLLAANLDDGGPEGARAYVGRRADRDDLAFVDDRDAVAEPLGLLDIVRGQQDGALLVAKGADERVDLVTRLRVETARRLIQEQELRIVDQREREREALLLPAGKPGIVLVAPVPKLEPFEQWPRVRRARVEGAEEGDRLANRDLVRQVRRLETDPDAVLEAVLLRLGIPSEHRDLAGATRAQPFQNLDGGGFSSAVRSEQTEDLARLYLEVDALYGFETLIGLPRDHKPRRRADALSVSGPQLELYSRQR